MTSQPGNSDPWPFSISTTENLHKGTSMNCNISGRTLGEVEVTGVKRSKIIFHFDSSQ
jgi:hypothetical protein